MRIKITKNLFDFLVEPGLPQEVAVGFGRDGKAVRHFNAFGGQFAVHLAKRGIFSADERDIVDPNFVQTT